ncbi:MAG TPA: type I polyketide synthase, partial [Vicinamibacteria bacterium]
MSAPYEGTGLEIAIIGMSCQVPGAASLEAFWANLREGVESISFFRDEELREAGVPADLLSRPDYVKAAGVLGDVARFDAAFFGCTPREAQVIDPQQRLFLERAWEALERAGYDPAGYPGAVGVYGGSSTSGYLYALLGHPGVRAVVSLYELGLATEKDFLATRVAYKLGLEGPAVTVQTACSTSLVAVHLACQSLLAGECDLALAGGVAVQVPEKAGYVYEPDGIGSRDGHTRAFDAAASGTVRGNGLGVVVLKRLADAVRDGDHISAVIRGSAMNNDGARKVGYTAPGVDGQARVIRAALATAGVAADTVGYVEAHGTATALGDPIEVAALTQAFREDTTRAGFCGLGSLKTNVGHLDPAAGVVGLIKAALMLEHGELVPSLNFERPNPKIDFARSPFYVVSERRPWTANGHPRRAGVSSFGIGGTNVHLVLEEAPAPPPAPALPPPPCALVVSARTPDALEAATDRLAAHLAAHPELRPDDVEFTLRHGRRAFAHRRTVVGGDLAEASRALAARDPGRTWSGVADERAPSVAFLFPGQGAQHVGMGRRLYETQPVFRSEVDAGCEVLRPLLGLDLREVLYPAGADEAAAEALGRTALTQPALFVVEHALAKLWGSWGVEPDSLIGHSVGEYVAATLAGVMRRDDALALVAERGRLMQECVPGAMLAVPLAAAEVGALLTGRLALAADNGFDACVVAGPHGEVAQLEAQLAGRGVLCSRLPTSHAFHCDLMDPILEAFAARVARVRLSPPRLPFVSNLSGTWISPAEATDPGYWARHLRHTVRFAEGVRALLADERRVLLEVGPGHALSSLARRAAGAGAPRVALPSLAHPRRPEPDDAFVLGTAARLWLAGVPVDWRAGRTARRVVLPTYPFEGERYWVDPPAAAAGAPAEKRADVAGWLYGVSWKRADPPPPRSVPAARWCVFADEGGFGAALAERLRAGGAEVTLVRAGARFAREGERAFVVAPASRADHEALLRALRADGAAPDGLVHAFGLDAPGDGDEPSARTFLGVLHLAQALGRVQEREARLFVLGTGVHDVTGQETLHPGQAAALGPCMVLGQEYPHLSGRYV